MSAPWSPFIPVRALFGLAFTAVLAASPLAAQPPEETFGEERRITVIDLVVAFESGAVREWAVDNPVPKGLKPEDFEVLHGGEARPVIAVEAAGEWHLVVYFDAVLTGSAGLRWAASALAELSEALAAQGEVAIVVADPEPRTLLAPTRDRERLEASFAELARVLEGGDELLALRSRTAAAVRQDSPEVDRGVLEGLPEEEERIVRARHDGVLLELVGRSGAGTQRAVILAGGGYDLRPQEFYQPLIAPASEPDAAAWPETGLPAATETLARTLAAYGWVGLHLLPPEPDPRAGGRRLGKLRLTGPAVEVEEQTAIYEQYDRTVIKLFGGRLEGQRKPKRAEAFLELGAALHAQGKLEDAEEALRQAIHHFAGDPKTAERQAMAFARLGAVLEEQGKEQEATAALALARRLDPAVTAAAAGPTAELLAPAEPLETLARATAGGVVGGAEELERALAGLGQRVRLTYQVTGPPDGELHLVEARLARGQRGLAHPRWARSSTLEPVAAARARRLLAGEPTGGGLPFSADFLPAEARRRGTVEVRFGLASGETPGVVGDDAVLRITLGYGGPDVEPVVEHRRLGPRSVAGQEVLAFEAGVELPEESSWLAVLVEDLDTGLWGGQLIELP